MLVGVVGVVGGVVGGVVVGVSVVVVVGCGVDSVWLLLVVWVEFLAMML